MRVTGKDSGSRATGARAPAADSVPECSQPPACAPRTSGFTLIELMVAVSIFAILLAVAVPSYRTFILNNRSAAAANEFIATLNFARTTAVTLRQPVSVCRTTTPAAAIPVCGNTGNGTGWENGWIAFIDLNANGILENTDATADTNQDGTIDATDAVLRRHEPLPAGTLLHGQAALADKVTFNSSGIATTTFGSLTLCDSRGWSGARVLVVGVGGRVQSLAPSAQTVVTTCQ